MGAAPSLVLGGEGYDQKFHLYQGGEDVLDDIQWFQSKNITHVVSICHRTVGDEVVQLAKIPEEHIIHIDELDSISTDLSKYFVDTTRFIHGARLKGGNVYVHCAAGISRSSTISLAYMMTWFDEPYHKLYPRLVMMRSCASPNQAFVEQLKNWEVSTRRFELRQEILEQRHHWEHIHERDRVSFLEVPMTVSQKHIEKLQWWNEDQNDEDDEKDDGEEKDDGDK